jgi:zinc protease
LGETLGLARQDPDYYALELGNHVLAGGFYATRLYHDLRQTTGLVYSVDASFDMSRTRGVYSVSFGCDPANVSRATNIAKRDVGDLGSTPVSSEELEQAKAILLRQIPLAQSSTGQIAQGLLDRIELGLPLDEPRLAARHYRQLGAAQVQKAFAKWVRPQAFVEVTRGPTPK